MHRRSFISTAAAATTGWTILASGTRAGAGAPSRKLNIALIGVWGRAHAFYETLKQQNVVALCDVDESHLAEALKVFPKAKTHTDWRLCLEQKDVDAVVICTTDHTHAMIANWALNRDMHVYCEKPLATTVAEARAVREKWLTKKGKLATQTGTQMHAQPNYARIREAIHDGAIGTLESAIGWGTRQIRRDGNLPAEGKPPSHLHYDLWLGPAPLRPYNPRYFSGRAGSNCLEWNMFWDFGLGQFGDMGCHIMDLIWNVIDAKLPTSIESKGEPFNPDVTPVDCVSHFSHPANDWRGPLRVTWQQGSVLPRSPRDSIDLAKIGHGAMFKGSKGFLIADYTARMILPYGDDADFTYYKPRDKSEQVPPIGNFQQQWIDACMDPSLPTACDFEYAGNLIEQQILGLVAYRAGAKISYDPDQGRVTDNAEANNHLSRTYREGWTLEG